MADSKKPKRVTRSAKTLTEPPKSRQAKTAESKAKKSTSAAAKKGTSKPAAQKPAATPQRAKKPTAARSRMDALIQKNSMSSADVRSLIEKKAYEIFESRGYESGREFDHWIEAERLILQEVQ